MYPSSPIINRCQRTGGISLQREWRVIQSGSMEESGGHLKEKWWASEEQSGERACMNAQNDKHSCDSRVGVNHSRGDSFCLLTSLCHRWIQNVSSQMHEYTNTLTAKRKRQTSGFHFTCLLSQFTTILRSQTQVLATRAAHQTRTGRKKGVSHARCGTLPEKWGSWLFTFYFWH